MKNKLIRKTFNDTINEVLIYTGKSIVDFSTPVGACKRALEIIEEHNQDRFIEEVLNGLKDVDTASLNAEKSLLRIYKSLQVIAKATTQDKLKRFKMVTINGIINQDNVSDDNYDLFIRFTDALNDNEFIFLYYLTKYIPKEISFDNEKRDFNDIKQLYNEMKEFISKHCNINEEDSKFIELSLIGYGFIKMASVWGGLTLAGLTQIAYDYIEFIKYTGDTNE